MDSREQQQVGQVAMEIMRTIKHLSWSSVSSYAACPFSWYLGYIKKFPWKPSFQMLHGTAVHETIQKYISQRAVALHLGTAPELDLEWIWTSAWRREVVARQAKPQGIDWRGRTALSVENEGLALMKMKPFSVQYLSQGRDVSRTFTSFRDFLDTLTLWRTKSKRDFSAPVGDDFGEPAVELWLPHQKITGVRPAITGRLDYIDAAGVPVDIKVTGRASNLADCMASGQSIVYLMGLEEAGHSVHKFKHLFITRTKKPRGQVILTEYTDEHKQWVRAWVRQVWRDMASGRVTPNPRHEWCKPQYCDHWGRCRGMSGSMPSSLCLVQQETIKDLIALNRLDPRALKVDDLLEGDADASE